MFLRVSKCFLIDRVNNVHKNLTQSKVDDIYTIRAMSIAIISIYQEVLMENFMDSILARVLLLRMLRS